MSQPSWITYETICPYCHGKIIFTSYLGAQMPLVCKCGLCGELVQRKDWKIPERFASPEWNPSRREN